MSNQLFNGGREGHLGGVLSFDNDDIRAMLVRSTYTFDATDRFLSDLGAVDNGRSAALSGKSITDGVADAADTYLNATSAVACNAVIIFKHTGSDATARVIAYVDTVSAGLPFTPSAGQRVDIVWDNGANRIYKL